MLHDHYCAKVITRKNNKYMCNNCVHVHWNNEIRISHFLQIISQSLVGERGRYSDNNIDNAMIWANNIVKEYSADMQISSPPILLLYNSLLEWRENDVGRIIIITVTNLNVTHPSPVFCSYLKMISIWAREKKNGSPDLMPCNSMPSTLWHVIWWETER